MINRLCSGAQTCPPGHLYLTQLQNDPEKIINYAMATLEDSPGPSTSLLLLVISLVSLSILSLLQRTFFTM